MRKLALHHWILIALAAGTLIGLSLNQLAQSGALSSESTSQVAHAGKAIGGLFLRLLQMVVVPLIASSLISGVTGMANLRHLGQLGGRTVLFYVSTSFLAIVTGLGMVNLLRPGEGIDMAALKASVEGDHAALAVSESKGLGTVLWDQLVHMVPDNPVQAAASGDMLPIIFFSLFFGVLLSTSESAAKPRLVELVNLVFDVMMRMTMLIIRLAPVGVFGFMLFATATLGFDVLAMLSRYMLTVALALLWHAAITLPLILRVFGKRSPLAFARAMQKALLTAFSTASSNATLPLTMRCVEDEAKVAHESSAFVLPLGATINMDGTALYEAVAVLFMAQALGYDLGLGQQVVVATTALLASVGAAGIPHAGLVMMVVVLEAVGLPTGAVALILGVDRVLDMARTTVNVWSDSVATAVIDRQAQALKVARY